MKISQSKGETSLTLGSLQGEEGGGADEDNNVSPLFYVDIPIPKTTSLYYTFDAISDMIEEEPPTDVAAFGFAITHSKREVSINC